MVRHRWVAILAVGCLLASVRAFPQGIFVTPEEARERLYYDPGTVFLDVREIREWNAGHLPGALLMSWDSGVLMQLAGDLPSGRDILIYDSDGARSEAAAAWLLSEGTAAVFVLQGGYEAFLARYGPVPVTFGADANGDYRVDHLDLFAVAERWGEVPIRTPGPSATPTTTPTVTPTPTPTCATNLGSLAGTLLDEKNKGLPGMGIALVKDATPPLGQSAVTDSAGRFRFDDLPAGPFALFLREPGSGLWLARRDPANANADTFVMAAGDLAPCDEAAVVFQAPLQIYYLLDANGMDTGGVMHPQEVYTLLFDHYDSAQGFPQLDAAGSVPAQILPGQLAPITSPADLATWGIDPSKVDLPDFPYWHIKVRASITLGTFQVRLVSGSRVSNRVTWRIQP